MKTTKRSNNFSIFVVGIFVFSFISIDINTDGVGNLATTTVAQSTDDGGWNGPYEPESPDSSTGVVMMSFVSTAHAEPDCGGTCEITDEEIADWESQFPD